MIREFLAHLTTPCSPHIRSMGYLDEALAMQQRFRRRGTWQIHLENSRRFLLSSAQKCRSRNRAVILGSGLLLDVPLAELSSLFHRVLLIDVVCLPQVRKQIRRYGNAQFIEHDVSTVAERLYRYKQRGIQELPEPEQDSSPHYAGADFVVSLNILSQLWVIPRAFLLTPRPRIDQEQLDAWCGRVVQSHYASLRGLDCTVCLIADYEYVKRDKEERIFSRGSTVYGTELPEPDDSWAWNIAPLGEESSFHSKDLLVGAWHFNK